MNLSIGYEKIIFKEFGEDFIALRRLGDLQGDIPEPFAKSRFQVNKELDRTDFTVWAKKSLDV